MKKVAKNQKEPGMREEYDFSGGVRGKYAKRYAKGSNVVILDPDVAKVFSSSSSVNDALRSLVEIAERKVKQAAR
jgi:hypothetical protein